MRLSRIAALALCAIVTAGSVAAAFLSINRLSVVPVSNTRFEVIESRGAGAAGIWCAASDYARRAGLDAPRKRLFIEEPRGKSRTTAGAIGVLFTTEPDDKLRNSPSSYSVSVSRRGENLTIAHAYQFCDRFFDDLFDRF